MRGFARLPCRACDGTGWRVTSIEETQEIQGICIIESVAKTYGACLTCGGCGYIPLEVEIFEEAAR